MPNIPAIIEDFLAEKKIAVAGVTRDRPGEAANLIYRKLRQAGYQVYALNPAAREVEGDTCYPALDSLPEKPGGVVLVTRPQISEQMVRECARLGIRRVWMHANFGKGSVSPQAVEFCRENGMTVIAGGCPMMFCPPVDFGHKCMRGVLKLIGRLPE